MSASDFVYVSTTDHARIAVKRRPNPGATPVILIHGLAVNADIWDLPDIQTDEYLYRSLAAVLHEAGFDLWMMNVRGVGAGEAHSEPAPLQENWCVDHFVLYDFPAVLDHVRAATGRRPFAIGHSMGAMTIAGALQGVRLTGGGPDARLVIDQELSRARQEALLGAVLIEFPAALRWPSSLFDGDGRFNWEALFNRLTGRSSGEMNAPFEMAARWGWLEAIIAAYGNVPLDRLQPSSWRETLLEALPKSLADSWLQAERAVVQAGLSLVGAFSGTTNNRADVIVRGKRYAVDQMKSGVLSQLAKSVRVGGFVSLLGGRDHAYHEHYNLVSLSNLVVLGGCDRIANADVTRAVFCDRNSAADKTCSVFPEIGHGEFEASPIATERVFPVIREWLEARDKRD